MIVRTKGVARALFLAAAGLTIAGLAGQLVRFLLGFDFAYGLIPALDLNGESNIPTWYATILLLLAALLLALIAAEAWQAKRPYAVHWSGLAILLTLLSLDEAVAIHEQWISPLRSLLGVTGLLYCAWVIPALASVLLVVLVYWRFFFALPKATKRRFLLAAALYVGGALGVELLEGYYLSHGGVEETIAFALMVGVEELLEMCGVVVLIEALLYYLGKHLEGPLRVVER